MPCAAAWGAQFPHMLAILPETAPHQEVGTAGGIYAGLMKLSILRFTPFIQIPNNHSRNNSADCTHRHTGPAQYWQVKKFKVIN